MMTVPVRMSDGTGLMVSLQLIVIYFMSLEVEGGQFGLAAP
jgi:hypothetical protein